MKVMKKNKLVRNQSKTDSKSVAMVQRFTVNLMPHQCRLENLEGRPHVVVPMVILTEGVHNGSNGPLYYGPDEMSKTPEAWNHKPVVVYHPEEGSACEKQILNERKVGIMLNTKFDPTSNRLKSEAWIEEDRADAIDERVMEAIHSREMMEVSTGVFVDNELSPGDWGGESYVGIARHFRPDHLAILPDQIGACSIADGAGLLRNAEPTKEATKLEGLIKARGLTVNKMLGVYSDFVIYNSDKKLFRLGYTSSDTGMTLDDGAPVEVDRVTEYRTVKGPKFTGNHDQSRKATTMDAKKKKEVIDALVANKDSGWSEDQRPVLEAMKDPQLEAQAKAFAPKKKEEAAPDPALNAEDDSDDDSDEDEAPVVKNKGKKPAAAPTKNNESNKFVYKDWLATAPREVQEMVSNGVGVLNEEKQKLITEITSNKNNTFTVEQLGSKPLAELRGMAALSRSAAPVEDPTRPAFYGGMAPTVTHNAGEGITPLALPTMDFSK